MKGSDCIPMYWWKNIKTLHPVMLKVYNNEIKAKSKANWLYKARTWSTMNSSQRKEKKKG